MNKEVKQKWIEALRSGMYKQGEGYLRQGDKFCCLGVLCDLYLQENKDCEGWYFYSLFQKTADPTKVFGILGENQVLPYSIAKWAGLPSKSPTVINNNTEVFLDVLNDDGESFKSISDLIEESL
jgi:hypothetical protein